MTERRKYKNIFRQILFLTLPLLILSGCSNQNKDKVESYNYNSIQFNTELIMFQIDDKFGEWGGDTYYIKMYRNNESKHLMIDYIEYEGKVGPPAPPDPNSKEKINWFTGLPILFEKKNIIATNQFLELISNSIKELTLAKLNIDKDVAMSGIQNQIMFSDSTLIINDYPSIKWGEFHKMINEIAK